MKSEKNTARLAGIVYLVVVLSGIINLMYVPSALIVMDDAAQTFKNIQSYEMLFRVGVISGLVCYIAFLILPIVLYKLLSHVNAYYAVAMVALAVISVPISLHNLLEKFAILELIGNPMYLAEYGAEKLPFYVMHHLVEYGHGIRLVSVFWGLWLFPFGYLVFRSGFLPKTLGILLMAGCFGYLTNFFGNFLISNYKDMGIAGFISLPASFGEIGICLYLLIIGVKTVNQNQPT